MRRSLLGLLALALTACPAPSPLPGPSPDLAGSHDLAIARDLAVTDAASPVDLARGPDLARPPDLWSAPTDAAVGSQGPNAAIDCGGASCRAPKSVCCRPSPFGAGTCIQPGDNCGSLAWYCDDPSDCAGGDVCCNLAGGSTCAPAADCQAAMGRRMCHQIGECLPGEMCCGVGPSPSYYCGLMCPISRRAYKEGIEYLDDDERRRLTSELLRYRLSTYRYKVDPAGAPRHLGFLIDDVTAGGPSPAVAPDGEHVDLYGYTSMAVAAIQEQAKEIEALRAEVRALRAAIGEAGKAPARRGKRR